MSRGTSGCHHQARGDKGQAAVELALVLPLVVVLALVLVQVALVVRDQVLVIHAAREAARAVAVDADLNRARAVVGESLDPARLDIEISARGRPGARARVELTYRSPTEVPLVGSMIGDVRLEGSATMRVER